MDDPRQRGSSGSNSQSPSGTMTPSSSSSINQAQDVTTLDLYIPRPAYQRPASYGQPSPSSCAHCGNLTPRYGTTTLYGTPLKQTPATSTEQLSRFSDRHSVVCAADTRRNFILHFPLTLSLLMCCRRQVPFALKMTITQKPVLSQSA